MINFQTLSYWRIKIKLCISVFVISITLINSL
nr:MAG TPA: hypothetical protein [Caudoviricetes sp.]